MVKPIVRSVSIFKKAEFATKQDVKIAMDLMDTLRANSEICVGMAANMIGVNKRIIAFLVGDNVMVMMNPVILKKSDRYETKEGCLSLDGTRKTTRYKEIEVEFYDMNFNKYKQVFSDYAAQVIQHEIDHCDGIVI